MAGTEGWYPLPVDIDEIMALAGRILLAVVFLAAAFGKITNFAGTLQYMESHGLPWTPLLCVLAILVEALGGMALMLGFQTRYAASLLGAFLIVATLVFHTGPEQRIHLLKNLAILGGLLQVAAFGAGPLSLEGRRGAKRPGPAEPLP